jgi:hypothetical protein
MKRQYAKIVLGLAGFPQIPRETVQRAFLASG